MRISNLMTFLLSVIYLLEERGPLSILELKTALGCSLQTTFEFGFANLYTLLKSYGDIFSLKVAATQERCQVSLVSNTESELCPLLFF